MSTNQPMYVHKVLIAMAHCVDDRIIIMQKGWTALMAAARRDRGDIVQILINRGASLEKKMTVSH